ncbi:MAG: polyprenyl synthetase family protein [Bacteroidales bacterium]|jgi:octaprenyl-diphosphate synthase|nr:polyprenyl synthetase family protein [Bacteroidales bacterium]
MLQQIFVPIQSEIDLFVNRYEKLLHSSFPVIDAIFSRLVAYRGKQLRPAMVFLSAGINGQITQQTHTAALALELLHCSSLIHDDVIDNGQQRHNQPTLNTLWDNKTAVLAGDYMLAVCMDLVMRKGDVKLLAKLSETAREMIQGELMQLNLYNRSISEEEYMQIIDHKTASLFASCFEMGVASAQKDETLLGQWSDLGRKTGIIFQLKDDLMDYRMDASCSKDSCKDIAEHKITLPFIVALRRSSSKEQQELWDMYQHHSGDKNTLQAIIDAVIAKGGIAYTEQLMQEQAAICVDFIRRLKDSEYKASLLLLIRFITERNF